MAMDYALEVDVLPSQKMVRSYCVWEVRSISEGLDKVGGSHL